MAKHSFERTRNHQATRHLLLAALVLGLGLSTSRGGQQSSKTSPPTPKPAPAAVQKKGTAKPGRPAKTPAQRKGTTANAQTSQMAEGKRDPFKLPPEPVANKGNPGNVLDSGPGGVLPPGTRGLLIGQLKLEGVVREQTANKMIAVVINDTKRAYFLTENESVYNGVVSKITPDSVYFTENVLDSEGRVTTREVVKRLNPAPGEGR
ncbi:MAG: hypothetical protein ABSF71_20540 [Terriglobia bacterium]